MLEKVIGGHLLGSLVEAVHCRRIVAGAPGTARRGNLGTILASDSHLANGNCAVAATVSHFSFLFGSMSV
jgi:hypothetical protein